MNANKLGLFAPPTKPRGETASDTPGESHGDEGAVTAEYAVVIMGAVAFAGVLVAIMRSGEVRAFLLNLIEQALNSAG